MWAEDGTLINPAGMSGKGRTEIEKIISGDMNTMMKGATMKMSLESMRPIGGFGDEKKTGSGGLPTCVRISLCQNLKFSLNNFLDYFAGT